MQLRVPSKYELRDLHQEIDFYDRKIAYCQNHDKFASEAEHSAAFEKLVSKRQTLVKSAAAMISMGIEYDPKQLPRSMKNLESS